MATRPAFAPPRSVAVVGLGKLGIPIAACMAAKGFRVVGVDLDEKRVDALNQGIAPIYEPGLPEMLAAACKNFTASTDLAGAIRETDLSMIIVPTPSQADGTFTNKFLLAACRIIGGALRTKESYHCVSITSTVMPGSTGGEIRELLEQTSGKPCGDAWGLCYSPEFVALGSVIHDFLNPDFILIGEFDSRSGDALEAIYEKIHTHERPVSRMSFANAELAKIAVNTYVTTKITFANMLAGICQRLPGGNVDAVTAAMGLDSRIGRKYLKGAIGYGGPCFPRDNVAMTALVNRLGVTNKLAETVDRANRDQVQSLARIVKANLPAKGVVGVLGLSYKPGTDVVEQSQGVLLAKALLDDGASVIAYDPAAMNPARAELGNAVRMMPSVEALATEADVIVIVTPWPEFKDIDALDLRRPGPRGPRVVIDCWRSFEAEQFEPDVRYVAVGVGPGEAEAAEEKQVA